MEEEVGIKVTRLRRRLSVEAEDVKSPSTQSTPTKKRGGRLAAKPQLELIDENVTEVEKPKRTRKSTVKDAEPEEKAVTPSRRSTRIRSNTSIVSETPLEAEDKGTPSRRSTRIKSNTSIIAETVPYSDSPRAKRAARRTSQVGSDTETAVTPARQTRRTRKDSTSSIDKQVESTAAKLGAPVKEVIVEESENNTKEDKNNVTPTREKSGSPSTRKSPRLIEKTGRKSTSLDSENKENEPKRSADSKKDDKIDIALSSTAKDNQINETTEVNNLSVSSSNLIKQLDSAPKKQSINLNKTTSDVEELPFKSKRHRTKSWTTISSSPSNENNFLSDTEAIKKKNKRKSNNLSKVTDSGDGLSNMSNKEVLDHNEQEDIKNVSLNSSTASVKKKNKSNDKSIQDSESRTEETSIINTSTKLDKSATELNKSCNPAGKDALNGSNQNDDPNYTAKFFSQAPKGPVQALVYIDDSDSNPGSIEKDNMNKKFDSEDQCVPVVEQHMEEEPKNNLSYEPMDIDETIPENITLSEFAEKNTSVIKDETDTAVGNRKSLLNSSDINNSGNKSQRNSNISNLENDTCLNKSKRKSIAITSSDDIRSNRKSISNAVNSDDDNTVNQPNKPSSAEEILNQSKRKSSILIAVNNDDFIDLNNDSMNRSSNKSKRESLIGDHDNSIEKENKSTRKSFTSKDADVEMNITSSDIGAGDDNFTNKSLNKSKRKSSISKIDEMDKDSLNIILDEDNMNKSLNKSKRKSFVSKTETTEMNDLVNSPNTSIKNITHNDSIEKGDLSKSTSVYKIEEVDDTNKSSLNVGANNDSIISKSSRKSKRKSSIIDADGKDSDVKNAIESDTKTLVSNMEIDEVDSSLNKSKQKHSIDNVAENINTSNNKSSRKSSDNKTFCDDNADDNSKKSKRKSSITGVDQVDNSCIADADKSSNLNKSKRKSSISHLESQTFDKSNNENKSTLVLSQIKDTSVTNTETSVRKDIYDFNESDGQLSKSINVPNVNQPKENDKKNLSLTYSTSTPLQQKSMKKLGMQINTSIIVPDSETKVNKKKALNKSKQEASMLSQNKEESEPSDDDDDEEEDSEVDEEDSEEEESEETMSKSKIIDDEAEEASEDYESGDSRDDEEREYEEQHEIVEKGETLSEEEDFSDDSDYEKGSFIVDSDDEDNELLSGSGDDLSMSADELDMSVKSKKKFNERKIKQQKKASQEIFEARHKLDESKKSKSKKSNRLQLESSDSESESEVAVQPKKNRRARIDSSQDISLNQSDTDKAITNKKKKVKRLSESVCEDINEKEISLHDSKDTEKIDPLSLQNVVKEEPKTPQKDFNISTVAVSNIEEVEEVQVDENVSIIKPNQTSDPLQATIVQDDALEDGDSDDDDSISENEEITNNYESVLSNLNKQSNKVKSVDVSLNLNKKAKPQAKEPIVDQLNLTQVKKAKKNKANTIEKSKSDLEKKTNNIEKVNKSINIQDDGSSDSIDMKLLFNEDSTDSESKVNEKQNDTKEIMEDFIPLKRTEGKTNIFENTDVNTAKEESILNISKSKKNKRKSSQPEETATANDKDSESLSFFIDTTGSHFDLNKSVTNTSITGSAKNNVSLINIEETKEDGDSNDTPLEVSFRSEKNKNKSKQNLDTTQLDETKLNTMVNETPVQSGKKKNKKSFSNSPQINIEGENIAKIDDDSNDAPLEVTFQSEKKKNKSKQALNTSQFDETDVNRTVNETPGQSSKKKNKKSLNSSQIIVEDQNIGNTDDVAEKSINVSVVSVTGSNKKKKKKMSESHVEETDDVAEKSINVSVVSVTGSNKKKKKRISESHAGELEIITEPAADVSIGSAKKNKQKPNNLTVEEENRVKVINEEETSKKRKRKPSANASIEEIIVKDAAKELDTSKPLNESLATTNKKKKRKVSHTNEDTNAEVEVSDACTDSIKQNDDQERPVNKKTKQKNKTEQQTLDESDGEYTKKNKKRKERDDDDGDKSSKVTKQNSFDKVYVPRLPADVILQLDDKPKKSIEPKGKVVSTTSFKVEEARKRRNKPSNYLEQSVYLNDSIEEKAKKSSLKKPKVLPFIPTASTSGYGFTTNFKVNVIPQETQFVAQSSDVSNFKKDFLYKNRIKKLGTFEMYKRHRNIKISKF